MIWHKIFEIILHMEFKAYVISLMLDRIHISLLRLGIRRYKRQWAIPDKLSATAKRFLRDMGQDYGFAKLYDAALRVQYDFDVTIPLEELIMSTMSCIFSDLKRWPNNPSLFNKIPSAAYESELCRNYLRLWREFYQILRDKGSKWPEESDIWGRHISILDELLVAKGTDNK